MFERSLSTKTQEAIPKIFPTNVDEVSRLLLDASGVERVHANILALSWGDMAKLRELAEIAKTDFRDVVVVEECPEDFLGIANRPKAAAEMGRRFTALGFSIPAHTAYWIPQTDTPDTQASGNA
ncbi:MAG TPA: hypothetical protein VF950_06250 [Planctomycetota bacterium]